CVTSSSIQSMTDKANRLFLATPGVKSNQKAPHYVSGSDTPAGLWQQKSGYFEKNGAQYIIEAAKVNKIRKIGVKLSIN
ncbi:MAG TPA: hypothetical protein DCF33_08800, partial [Saprospirales bacterium]|nr:hypothetical protein [Saprospirales bacterium]